MENNKVMGILCYLSILFLVPFFMAKDDPFVRYHLNQGIVLFAAGILVFVLSFVPIVKIFAGILGFVVFVFSIIGIINVVKGEMKPIPFIGGIEILK